jgi:hypothetical protein
VLCPGGQVRTSRNAIENSSHDGRRRRDLLHRREGFMGDDVSSIGNGSGVRNNILRKC